MENAVKIKKELSKVHIAGKFSQDDISKISDFIDTNESANYILSPNVLAGFFSFARKFGFPATESVLNSTFEAEGYRVAAVNALVQGNFLTKKKENAKNLTKSTMRSWNEKEGDVWVYDYSPDLLENLGDVIIVAGVKTESYDIRSAIGEIDKAIYILEGLNDEALDDEKFFQHLDDDTVAKFGNGLLLVLAELQSEGKIPKFDNASDVKAALKAAVRKINQSQGNLGNVARKYQRFGADRVLRNTSKDIRKAQRSR